MQIYLHKFKHFLSTQLTKHIANIIIAAFTKVLLKYQITNYATEMYLNLSSLEDEPSTAACPGVSTPSLELKEIFLIKISFQLYYVILTE